MFWGIKLDPWLTHHANVSSEEIHGYFRAGENNIVYRLGCNVGMNSGGETRGGDSW